MILTRDQKDRALGVLLGCAVGDALGIPYEFKPARDLTGGDPGMPGGGPFGYEPGEFSDDTQMTLCIARPAAWGADFTTTSGLDMVAREFSDWYRSGPKDVGGQVSSILATKGTRGNSLAMTRRATGRFTAMPKASGGNGSLMRTSPVALRYLDDPEKLAEAARNVSALTHADPDCLDACVIWCFAIRGAVLYGDPYRGLMDGVDMLWSTHRDRWWGLLDKAEKHSPAYFRNNGWVVHAIQAAWSACATAESYREGVLSAISCGLDTDTVGAIAGALLGATYGATGIPRGWGEALYWNGADSLTLESLADKITEVHN